MTWRVKCCNSPQKSEQNINYSCTHFLYDKEPAALQEAISSGGYFFRQYGLIADGKYVKESSRWKYSSRRRALCLKDGQDFIVETLEAETFPRFSYVLEDLNVDAAIYLVGGDSYAYGRDRDGDKIASGIFDPILFQTVCLR